MRHARVVTVTLSSAIDRVIVARGLSRGGSVAAREVSRLPGGKGFNAARGIAALGGRCTAAGLVGSRRSEWFRRRLRELSDRRVGARLVLTRGGMRECFTIRDPAARSEWHLRTEPGEVNTADAERLVSQVLSLVGAGGIVALCGSSPPGAGLACFLTLFAECRARGARVAVDTSGESLAAVLEDPMWLLKINADELSEVTGRKTGTLRQVAAAARALCRPRTGASRVVIVTRGRSGAVMASSRGVVQSRASINQRRVAGTVGCGDALLAGVLEAKSRGRSWSEALRLGVASASALAVSETPGVFTRQQAMMQYESTTVEPL
ncbi:MAG: hypothetical protein JNK58_07425 [Phycisphaerae bacterium]|nr:hypothetical protein [Phycisphaerae bacterium]